MSEYPEHDKLTQVQPMSKLLGEFLDYGGYILCWWDDRVKRFVPVTGTIESILADYFHLDLGKLDAEKQQMLDRIRSISLDPLQGEQ